MNHHTKFEIDSTILTCLNKRKLFLFSDLIALVQSCGTICTWSIKGEMLNVYREMLIQDN